MAKMSKTALSLLAGFVLVGAAAGQAVAETRFAVQDATGTVDKMVVTDTGAIGIGTSTPSYPFQLKAGGPAAATSMEIRNTGRATGYTPYDAPNLQFTRNNDATVNGGAPNKGDRLGLFAFGSWFGGTVRYSSYVVSYADSSTGNSTSMPGYLTLETTAAGDSYPTERVRVASTGNVGIGTSNPTQKLEVKGGLRLNTTSAKPATCDSTVRGVVWVTQAASGTADSVDVCLRDASGNYAWTKLN